MLPWRTIVAILSVVASTLTGCSFVSLQQFYARVDPSVPIDVDPIGGYMLLYWIDSDGAACHGSPGVSGQPGPAAITVARPQAIADSTGNATVALAQLADYQRISYTLSDYFKSNAGGPHLFQFDNLLWRLRASGQAFRDGADHHYSVPQVIDIDHRAQTLSPVYAWGIADCDQSQFFVIGDVLGEEQGQHPTRCR